jgi:hypothetical protein
MTCRHFTVGRTGNIILDDPAVSSNHAVISINGGEIYLRDLKSTNGVFIHKNYRWIRFYEGYLMIDQRILLGQFSYTISELLGKSHDFHDVD